MSIERARQLLGSDANRFSNENLEEMIKSFEIIAGIVIDQHLKERE